MQKTNFIVSLLTVLILLNSCQKEVSIDTGSNGNNNPGTTVARPKTYTEEYTDPMGTEKTTFNISYDASNRVTGLVSAADPGTKLVYTYSSATLAKLDIFDAGLLSIHVEYYLNANNQPDSSFQYNDTGDSTTEKYIYNSAKQLQFLKNYVYSKQAGGQLDYITSYEYDAAGNLVKESVGSDITTYEYTSQTNPLVNLNPFTMDVKRLVKTTTIEYAGGKIVLNHTYTFDAANRLTSERMATADNSIILVKSYTY